jgi:uncharacterized DUF497 family protein
MSIEFEWDAAKAEVNLRKHGVSFEEATTAFYDNMSITIPDPLHSEREARFVLLAGPAPVIWSQSCMSTAVREFVSSVHDQPRARSANSMKRQTEQDMLPEYDFSRGVRGKYVGRLAKGSNVVVLDRDVQRMFPDSAAVNAALRALGKAVEVTQRPATQSRRAARLRPKPARAA